LRIETFEIVPTIDFYVITMGKPDRENNIKLQIEQQINIMFQNPNENDRFNFDIKRIDAVVGKNLDLDLLINNNRLDKNIYIDGKNGFNMKLENRKNEIGCYLSHYKTYETIRDNGNPMGYSVIFEDDFVLNPDFLSTLDNTMIQVKNSDIDFDIIFLGITGNTGDKIIDNVYAISGVSWCAHGYLVNNKSINKILEKIWLIDNVIDAQIFKKGEEKELIIYRLDPTIVHQGNYGTQIRNN
jgi:GR25 family glycosyltransferase involved in LPS biosynthesis